ncbi:MAG: GNAT family N-acetyltransferase [Desulfuromonadaceae bacterium]|nr:GNAT family N-acetyltransferase [Desulfuromonadaceae bacterium]
MSDESYPHQYECRLLLKNGREVFIRPILPSDGHLLVELFNKMSPRSRYLRFMTNLRELPEELLHNLTHLDYYNGFALACLVEEDGKDAIIAVGRYSLDPDENIADLALAVRDDWQQQGIGKTLLLNIISIGKEHGISRFGSVMDPQNHIMKQTLLELGYQVRYFFRGGSYQVEILV